MEAEEGLTWLSKPELYLADRFYQLAILDEIRCVPKLFLALRGLIDKARLIDHRFGLYLFLDSAALEMLKQSGETLAGRVSYLELNPIDILEIAQPSDDAEANRLWSKGGFPESFLAEDGAQSLRWRRGFIRKYLERNIPQFGRRIPAEALRRFWVMLAHHQSGCSM